MLIFLVFFLTLISQTPYLKQTGASEILVLVWLFPLPIVFFKKLNGNKAIRSIFSIYFLWLLSIILLSGFSDFNYVFATSWTLRGFSMAVFLVFMGFYYGQLIEESTFIKILVWASLIAAPIICVNLYFNSFTNYDIQSREYAYIGKNSISQILLSCFIMITFLYRPVNKVTLAIKFGILGLIIIIMLFVKSRASILGYGIIVFVLLFVAKDKEFKRYTAIFLVLAAMFAFIRPDLVEILFYSILLGGRDVNDINDISSGRMGIMDNAIPSFLNHIFLGSGEKAPFVESFPISILIQYGILVGTFIFFFLVKPVGFFIKKCTWKNPLDLCFGLLILTYYFNSIFEQQAPLGPGTKCFMLWFIFGVLLFKRSSKKRDLIVNKTRNNHLNFA